MGKVVVIMFVRDLYVCNMLTLNAYVNSQLSVVNPVASPPQLRSATRGSFCLQITNNSVAMKSDVTALETTLSTRISAVEVS